MHQDQVRNAISASAPGRTANGGVARLAAEIAAACEGGFDTMSERMKAALKCAAADPTLLNLKQRELKAECYARHVIHSDPAGRFTILAIVWASGQFSPPHAHHTWCAYAVHENPLEETVYRFDPETSTAAFVATEARNPGYSCFAGAGLDQIHRLGNSGSKPAISIHVYGVESVLINTHVNRILSVAK